MNTSEKTKRFSGKLHLLPIIVFCAVVPLIIYTKYTVLTKFIASNWMGQPISVDIFSYYKMIVIICCAAASLFFMVYRVIKSELKIKISLPFLLAAIYGLLVLISAILSEYPGIAFWGSPERYEGAVVIISYLIIFIYALSVIDNMQKVKIIINSILVSSFIVIIIGVLQFLGYDIFKTDFFRLLFNMRPGWKNLYEVSLDSPAFTTFSTLYNANNFAFYLTLIFPLTLMHYSTRPTLTRKIFAAFLVFLCVLAIIASSTSGAYYAVFISTVILIILSFPYIKKNLLNSAILIAVVISMLFITNILTSGRVAYKLNFVSVSSEIEEVKREDALLFINDIVLDKTSVFVYTTDKNLNIFNENNEFRVYDETGRELELIFASDTGDYRFTDSKYDAYSISANENKSIFSVKAAARIMYFHMTTEGIKVPGMGNNLYDIQPVERNAFLYRYPYVFSGRGYIWSGMLPILKDTVLIGKGADTTFLTYPQYDYIGKVNMLGKFNVVIEKPHCHYLQIAHDSGWISLLLMFILFGYYAVSSLVVIYKYKPLKYTGALAVTVLCGIISYLTAALMYDSSVLTAPVFWTLLAMGFSVNSLVKSKATASANPVE